MSLRYWEDRREQDPTPNNRLSKSSVWSTRFFAILKRLVALPLKVLILGFLTILARISLFGGYLCTAGKLSILSAFSVLFNAILRPFVAAVLALVSVLKFFNVNDDWFPFFDNGGVQDAVWIPILKLGLYWSISFCSYQFLVQMGKFLAHKFDVESSPTLWTVSKKLHFRRRLVMPVNLVSVVTFEKGRARLRSLRVLS